MPAPAARLAASCLQGEAGATALTDPEGRRELGLNLPQPPPRPPPCFQEEQKVGAAGGEPLPVQPRVAGEPGGQRDSEMADEPDWLDLLGRWTYGVDPGGRVFFIKYVALISYFFKVVELERWQG